MPSTRVFRGSFVGGEISKEMFGRIDDSKFQNGAASIQNFIATPLGAAEKRAGFQFVSYTKNNGPARLIPFTYSTTQTMVIEIGPGYFRFHTNGQTVLGAGANPYIPAQSSGISASVAVPTVLNWPKHGLTTGQKIGLFVPSVTTTGLQRIDIEDGGAYSTSTPPRITISGSGAGTATAVMESFDYPVLVGHTLESITLWTVASIIITNPGAYTAPPTVTFASAGYGPGRRTATAAAFVAAQAQTIPPNLTANTAYYVTVIDANNINVSLTNGGSFITVFFPGNGTIGGYGWYAAGDQISYGGGVYQRADDGTQGLTPPPPNSSWTPVSGTTPYEVPNSYLAGDLFDIHYVQSADVLTLVHPNYPPSELSRLGPTNWTFTTISFGQILPAPLGLAITPTLGYSARISSIALGSSNPLITTVANHSLALGDGVYIKGLTANLAGGGTKVIDGFWLVSLVPFDGSGNLINNELYLEDYSGNPLSSSGWTSYTAGATIQYGSQIVDITRQYVVTAMAPDGIQQSPISAAVSALNNLYVTGSFNTLTWNAVPGASQYYVYKQQNGLYGYIGNTPNLTFSDTNIAPDMSITPDNFDAVFSSPGNYPGAVSYFQQRKCFGGTDDQPQNFWMTKTGTEADMSYSLPVQDTDRIAIAIAAREVSTIRHIIPLLQLLLLTSSCEISASPQNGETLTPSTICANPQSYIGASNVGPIIVNNSMLFVAARGGHVREMGYQWQAGGYLTGDISLRASHLFNGLDITDAAFSKCPWPVAWFVSTSGNLLALTYIPEEQVGAWHHHVTDGTFQSVAVVAEGIEDRLYAVITRQINGQTVNCVERMGARLYGGNQNAFFADCGAAFDGTNTSPTTMQVTGGTTWGRADTLTLNASTPTFAAKDVGSVVVLTGQDGATLYRFTVAAFTSATQVVGYIDDTLEAYLQGGTTATWAWARSTISGLTWLLGKTVSVLADGAVLPQCVVDPTGTITIQRASVVVQIGLPYTAEIDTLPLVLQVDGSGQGRNKNINKVWLKLYNSGSVFAGPSVGKLVEYKQRTLEPFGSPPNLLNQEIELAIPPTWDADGGLSIVSTSPLPLTVVGITAEVEVGG